MTSGLENVGLSPNPKEGLCQMPVIWAAEMYRKIQEWDTFKDLVFRGLSLAPHYSLLKQMGPTAFWGKGQSQLLKVLPAGNGPCLKGCREEVDCN